MNSIECIQNFSKNMRREKITPSCAQVMLAIIDGKRRVKSIIDMTGLHSNTIGTVLRVLVHERFITRYGEQKPYTYRATRHGECLCYNLLKPAQSPRLKS